LFNGNSLEPPGWKPVLEGEKFTTLYIRGNVSFGHNIFLDPVLCGLVFGSLCVCQLVEGHLTNIKKPVLII
ncbi:MAG: hypothetical protein OES18_13215, partial [Deltaproteobacteria bacterium]|nr:hypothetical protein [Deltaproteobacteria bacterium]